jgi:hypothetical protein
MTFKMLVTAGLALSFCRADQIEIKPQYKPFIKFSSDSRPVWEKALNSVGLTTSDVGMSFALVAGVSHYPKMALTVDRELAPADEDVTKIVAYLRDREFFNEIVVLKDDDVNYENLRYFLEVYFPARLKVPKSRFLFAYSGHGFSEGEGPTGYLLKSSATSKKDKENAINMNVIHDLLGGIVENGHEVLALINACTSGAFLRQPFGGSIIPREPGAHAITSGGKNPTDISWSDARIGTGSIFFERLLTGLGGTADASKDGVVTVDELFSYLKNQISAFTNQNQVPMWGDLRLKGSSGGFFFLNRDRQISARLAPSWDPRKARSFGDDVPLKEFRGTNYAFYYPADWINLVSNYGLLIPQQELLSLAQRALQPKIDELFLRKNPSAVQVKIPDDEFNAAIKNEISNGNFGQAITVGSQNIKFPEPGTPGYTQQPRVVGGVEGTYFRLAATIGWVVRRGNFGVVMMSKLDPAQEALFENLLASLRFY